MDGIPTPIELLLDSLDWEPVEGEADGGGERPDVPHATHSGVLTLGLGVELRVFQFSDGRRVIAAEDFERLFGPPAPA